MNMDNVQVFTKNITIIVQLQDANFDYLGSVGDFDVTIEAGPENETGDKLEFEGPTEQIKAFEAKRKEINDASFLRALLIL